MDRTEQDSIPSVLWANPKDIQSHLAGSERKLRPAYVAFCAGFSDARQGDAGDARRMAASEKRRGTKSRAGWGLRIQLTETEMTTTSTACL
jgi:hypothetical protein